MKKANGVVRGNPAKLANHKRRGEKKCRSPIISSVFAFCVDRLGTFFLRISHTRHLCILSNQALAPHRPIMHWRFRSLSPGMHHQLPLGEAPACQLITDFRLSAAILANDFSGGGARVQNVPEIFQPWRLRIREVCFATSSVMICNRVAGAENCCLACRTGKKVPKLS